MPPVRATLLITFVVLALVVKAHEPQFNLTDSQLHTCCKLVHSKYQLCSVDAYQYAYCEYPATCDLVTHSCSDNTPKRVAFTKPIDVPPDHLVALFTRWGYCLTVISIALIFWQRNNHPMRTRNIYFNITEVLAQMLVVRLLMGQQETDPCFVTQSINIVCLASKNFNELAQLMIYKAKVKGEKAMAKLVNSTVDSLGTSSLETVSPRHMLDSFSGALLVAFGFVSLGFVTIYIFTDVPFTNYDSCNNKYGFPGVSRCGVAIGYLIITALVMFAIQNPETVRVTCIKAEVWLAVGNSVFTLSFLLVMEQAMMWLSLHNNKLLAELIHDNITHTSFMLVFTVNVLARIGFPTMYHELIFKKQSVVTDKLRQQFLSAVKQPFELKQLVDYAGSELETDSILLYQAVRSIVQLRRSTANSFNTCERLSKFVFENYIIGSRRTLDHYGLRGIVKSVKSPIELLEKETTVLVELNTQIQERIMLPMFARMIRQQTEKPLCEQCI